MKVAHQTDYDTHAVIGGSEAKAFAISQTAEFFTVLSNTLYSNKPLAVVREVLCNAWDSHIASGVQHIPVNITVDADAMTIRDYGAGIHPDLMHQIYCVYGASTKENDGLQTGGFGLGSKAPFAYSDHFTVTTHHKGLKTVYAISRSSGAAKGTPELRAMVQVPTLEQGIEVKIPIVKLTDVAVFKEIIQNIAAYGEMNVVLNKKHIPIIPISTAESNVFLSRTLPYSTNDLVHVRYGNVIYPVPEHEDYSPDMHRVINSINAVTGDRWGRDATWYLIVQAPPHSISVTPSRESLSMTDTSINTLRGIFSELVKVMDVTSQTFDDRMARVAMQEINEDWLAGRPYKLVSLFGGEYYRESMEKKAYPEYFNKLDQLAEYALARGSGISEKFRKRLTLMRIKSLIAGGYRRKDALTQMYHILKYNVTPQEYSLRNTKPRPFNKQVIRPIIKKLVKNNLSFRSLYITINQHTKAAIQGTEFIPIQSARLSLDKQMELLSGVVIFTSSKTAFVENYYDMGYISRNAFRKNRPNFVFVAPKKEEERKRAKQVFENMGFLVIDFYTYYQENCIVEAPAGPVIPSKPRPEGIPSLKNNLRPTKNGLGKPTGGFYFDKTGYRNPFGDRELIRIKDPELMFKAYNVSDRYDPRFFSWGDAHALFIVKYWGERSGIVANELQWEKLKSQGVKPGEEVVFKEVIDYVENSESIKKYYEEKNSGLSYILTQLRNIGTYSKVIRDIFPVVRELSDKDQEYLDFFNNVLYAKLPNWEAGDKDNDKIVRALAKKLKAIPTSPTIVACQQIVDKNERLLNLLDLNAIERLLIENPNDRYAKTYAEIAIINALKN